MAGKIRARLRKDMRTVIGGLDGRWQKAASNEVCNNLSTIIQEYYPDKISNILAWSKFFPGEVDLSHFIGKELEDRSVYLPRSLSDFSMTFISIGRDWSENIENGIHGIPEPSVETGQQYNISQASRTVVIVPGLAFDRSGNRIGRGKGYYDRFLSRPGMQDAVKIGVCWSLQIVENISPESYDIPVDWVCHERGFFRVEQPS